MENKRDHRNKNNGNSGMQSIKRKTGKLLHSNKVSFVALDKQISSAAYKRNKIIFLGASAPEFKY